MKYFLIGVVLLFISHTLQAQTEEAETRGTLETEVTNELKEQNHNISLDFVPTLIANSAKGIGISYSYRIVSGLSLGAFADYYETDEFLALFSDITWTQASAGIETKYYFSDFSKGFYLGAAATYVYLKGEGTTNGLFSSSNASVEDDADKFGYLAKIGYAFEGNTMKSGTTFIIDFAVNYGTGNEFEYTTSSNGSQGTLRVDEIREGVGLYGALGLTF